MEVQASTLNVRMSAQKMREVVRQIQGLNARQAQALLAVVPRKSRVSSPRPCRARWRMRSTFDQNGIRQRSNSRLLILQSKLSAASDRKETRQVHARIGAVSEFPGFEEQTRRREALGERGAGSDRDNDAACHPEGAWFRRADSKAELPHQIVLSDK